MMSVCHIDSTGWPKVPRPAGRYRCPYTGTIVGTCASMRVAVATAEVMSVGRWPQLSYQKLVAAGTSSDPEVPALAGDQDRGRPDTGRGWLRTPAYQLRYPLVTTFAFAALAWRLPAEPTGAALRLIAWLVLAGAGALLAAIDIAVHGPHSRSSGAPQEPICCWSPRPHWPTGTPPRWSAAPPRPLS